MRLTPFPAPPTGIRGEAGSAGAYMNNGLKSFTFRSLIQIHYHDRLSGVNKVIGLYAKAFDRIAAHGRGASLVLCAKSPKPHADFAPAQTVDMPLGDYRDFDSKSRFECAAAALAESIGKAIGGKSVETPVAIVGHNLSMGKNCALSAAFAQVARKHAGRDDAVRFYSVLHDFAEEGRSDCLAQIDKVKKWTDIENDLFPADGSFGMITLNANNAGILERAGFPADVLHNPVEGRPADTSRLGSACAANTRPESGGERPVILYPSRCISRKNILESILVCTFIYKADLLIGAAGTAARDRAVFETAVALCKKHRLPVTFDYGKVFADKSEKGVFTDKAFDVADACITTSVAEGFGYGLYEPWLYGKAVFGRKYLGFEPLAGVGFPGLYDRLPVPVQWISVVELRQKYWETMQKCFGKAGNIPLLASRKRFDKAFTEYFINNHTVDFGALDVPAQFKILESLLKSPGKTDEWEIACGDRLSIIGKSADKALYKSEKTVRYNQGRIQRHLSLAGFSGKLAQALSSGRRAKISGGGNREDILRQFCGFERFRLLLAK